MKRCRCGVAAFSLVELAVAIAVLLALTTLIGWGVAAWREVCQRQQCIAHQYVVQKSLRWYQAQRDLHPGDPVNFDDFYFGSGLCETSQCKSGGTYLPQATVPFGGAPYLRCSISSHAPSHTSGW